MSDKQIAGWDRAQYLTEIRCLTHWYQWTEVRNLARGSVLEIGPGAGHTTWMMREYGLQVTTMDYDEDAMPDVVGDVRSHPFDDDTFDTILAAEVLEHIPFEDLRRALRDFAGSQSVRL